MNAYMFLKLNEKKHIDKVCEKAGTSYSWFRLIAHGHGKLSVDLAIKLEGVSKALGSGDNYMTVEELFDIKPRVEGIMKENRLIGRQRAEPSREANS